MAAKSNGQVGTNVVVMQERRKSLMLRAWILAGLFFMALPGTLLGFSNLVAIAAHHGAGSLPAAWMEGHGHAQMFGWIGSFILGIGFYSQPARGRAALRMQMACFALWVSGVGTRWATNIYGWHWRTLAPVSAGLEVVAVLIFLAAARQHKLPQGATGERRPMEMWMVSVLVGTAALLAGVILNLVECVRLAVSASQISFPHTLDQRYLVLLGWGFLVPIVWGFSARWFPAFLAISAPDVKLMQLALGLDVAGVTCGVCGWMKPATFLLAAGAVTIAFALHLLQRPHGRAKVQGIHPSFPVFARVAYAWLVVASTLGIWAAFADQHGGIWGASRHALTVGFAATMVFTIGPRILPHFGGIYYLFSKRLMFVALLLLQTGCTLRVLSEPLAYEGIVSLGWKVLPVSGVLELCGVLVFAANMALTYAVGKRTFASLQESGRAAA